MTRRVAIRQSRRAKPTVAKSKVGAVAVYQFKISLRDSKPLIWRRIQVRDCTLNKLHEHVQTAMGWENGHLHQFRIGKQFYGDPGLMQELFEDAGFKDSMKTMISEIVPADSKRFSFFYEYDFGDGWLHEIRFEKICEPEAGSRYPACIAGERACPPEDCGGVWGYAELLATMSNKKHPNHSDMLEWLGGPIDPEAFDPSAATRAMKGGLPTS